MMMVRNKAENRHVLVCGVNSPVIFLIGAAALPFQPQSCSLYAVSLAPWQHPQITANYRLHILFISNPEYFSFSDHYLLQADGAIYTIILPISYVH